MFALCLLWQDSFLYNNFLTLLTLIFAVSICGSFSVPEDQCASYKTRLRNAPTMCAKGKPPLFHVLQPFKASVGIFSIFLHVVNFFNLLQVRKKKKSSPVFAMSAPIREQGGAQSDAFGPYTEPIYLKTSR